MTRPPPTPDPSQTPGSSPPLSDLLDRPAEQRAREHQYRFGQSCVFGLSVLGLQAFGNALGGPEAGRWVGILQALLTGWVVYVAAAGMLFDGLLWLTRRRRLTVDLLPASVATGLYLSDVARVVAGVAAHVAGAPRPGLDAVRDWPATTFHWTVLLLIVWTGGRWWWLNHSPASARPAASPGAPSSDAPTR